MATTFAHDRLRADAQAAAAGGDPLKAAEAYRDLLKARPDDIEALNFLAIVALARQDLPDARQLLGHALQVEPDHATTRKNFGLVLLHAREPEAAEQVLRPALLADPAFHTARLYLGTALEHQGRHREAVAAYLKALTGAQSEGQWLDAHNTPAALRPAVEHALAFVRTQYPAVLHALLDPLHERHGRDALARVRKCLSGYLGEERVVPPGPDQRPTFLYFPDLPTTPFFEPGLFPWRAELESRTPGLKAELRNILEEDMELVPFLGEPPPGMKSDYLGGQAAQPQWDAFFFHRHGRRNEENCRRAPLAAAALDSVPIVRIPGHAPEALLSVLGPGSHILPHAGVTNTRVVTHLPLLVPGDCTLRVADQRHDWQEGRCVTFDDTFEHEAWNNSELTRVVLLFDVWNPHLTEVERDAVTELVTTIGELKDGQL